MRCNGYREKKIITFVKNAILFGGDKGVGPREGALLRYLVFATAGFLAF